MPLFSRGPKKDDDRPEPAAASGEPRSADAAEAPHVPISLTSYGDPAGPVGASASGAPAGAPGTADNVLLAAALAALPATPEPGQLLEVARQLLQGRVLLRVRGDARELLAAGENLPISVAGSGERRFALVFSGATALQTAVRRDGEEGTTALGVPVPVILQQIVEGSYAGLVIDAASSPASATLPRALIERVMAEAEGSFAVKAALTGERTAASVAALVEALAEAPLWVAARREQDGTTGIAQMVMPDGVRVLEVFSHPLELHVLGRGDQPVKVTAAQLVAALRGEPELGGIALNPAGPWMRLDRDDLAPLFAD